MPLRDWKKGDGFSASHLNEAVRIARSVETITGSNGIVVAKTANGTTIAGTANNRFFDTWLGVVTNGGPNGPTNDPDYTDNRYWVKKVYADCVGVESDIVDFEIDGPPRAADERQSEPIFFTVTNTAEDVSGTKTHILPTDETRFVRVFGMYDVQSPQVRHYVMAESPKGGLVVLITGNAAGGGKYEGVIKEATSTAAASGDLSLPEGMATGDVCRILNANEDGASTHDLSSGTYWPGILVGKDTDGTWIVLINSGTGTGGGGGCFPSVKDVFADATGLYEKVYPDSGCVDDTSLIIDFTECDGVVDGGTF